VDGSEELLTILLKELTKLFCRSDNFHFARRPLGRWDYRIFTFQTGIGQSITWTGKMVGNDYYNKSILRGNIPHAGIKALPDGFYGI